MRVIKSHVIEARTESVCILMSHLSCLADSKVRGKVTHAAALARFQEHTSTRSSWRGAKSRPHLGSKTYLVAAQLKKIEEIRRTKNLSHLMAIYIPSWKLIFSQHKTTMQLAQSDFFFGAHFEI